MFTQGGLTTPKGPAAVRAPSSALSASKQERLEALRNERLRIMQAQASLLARPRSVGRSAAGTPFGRSLASPPPSQATVHLEEIEKLKSEIRQLKINEELAKEKIAELEAALRRHRAEDGSTNDEINRLKQQLTREKDRVFTLATEKQRLEEELQETKIEKFRNEQLENEVKALKHQVTEAGHWKEERESLKQVIETIKKDGEIVRNQYKTEKSQRLVLAAKVEQLEKELRFDRRPTVLAAETIGVVTWKGPSPKHVATEVSPHSDATSSVTLPGIDSRRPQPTREASGEHLNEPTARRIQPTREASGEHLIETSTRRAQPVREASGEHLIESSSRRIQPTRETSGEHIIEPSTRRPQPVREASGEYHMEASPHILLPEPQGGGSSSRASSHRSVYVEPKQGPFSSHGAHVETKHVLSSHGGAESSHRALHVDEEEYHVESKRDSSPFAAKVEPRQVSPYHAAHIEHVELKQAALSSHVVELEPQEVILGGRGGGVKKIASFVDPFAAGEDEYVDDTSSPRGDVKKVAASFVDPFAAADEMMETPMKTNHGSEKRPSEVSFVDVEQRGSARKESTTAAAPPDISTIFGGPSEQEQRVASIPEHTETHQWKPDWETTQRSWDIQQQHQHQWEANTPQVQHQQQWEASQPQVQHQQHWEVNQPPLQHQQQWEVNQPPLQHQQKWEGQGPIQQPQVHHQQQGPIQQPQVQHHQQGPLQQPQVHHQQQAPLPQPHLQNNQAWETRSQPPQQWNQQAQWTQKPASEQTQPVQNWGGPSPTNQQQWYNPVVLQPTSTGHPVMKQTIPGRPSPSNSPKAPPMQFQAAPQTHASQHPAFVRPQVGQAPIAPVGTQYMPQNNQGYMQGAPPPQFRQTGQPQGSFRY